MDILDMKHLGITAQCGLCGDDICGLERVIALYGDDESTTYRGHTRPFAFPHRDHAPKLTFVNGIPLCRRLHCPQCIKSPEHVLIHYDCFEIFKTVCSDIDTLQRLWVISAWKRPWRGAQPLHFVTGLDRTMLREAAVYADLQQLNTLPNEILELIYAYSPHASLWRCASVLRLASYVSSTVAEPLRTYQLGEILVWKRNEKEIELVTSPEVPPFLAITIDSHGIREIERHATAPLYSGESCAHSAFIVEREDALLGVEAQMKDGLLRMRLFPGLVTLPIWNTSAPPDLSPFRTFASQEPLSVATIRPMIPRFPPRDWFWRLYYAVEADKIKGITFFFTLGDFTGAFFHQTEESCAMLSYERFHDETTIWVYVPLVSNDRLLTLGVRPKRGAELNILIRTQLTGDTIIGPHITFPLADVYLAKYAPMTLLYAEPVEGMAGPLLGADCKVPTNPKEIAAFPPESSRFALTDPISYHSSAPLDGIRSTTVFHDQDNRTCKGILFEYENGGCRTVGQCRLHIDPSMYFYRPSYIYYLGPNFEDTAFELRVEFAQKPFDVGNRDPEWNCSRLQGTIKFWFTHQSSVCMVGND